LITKNIFLITKYIFLITKNIFVIKKGQGLANIRMIGIFLDARISERLARIHTLCFYDQNLLCTRAVFDL
jgi:hypothetical protein